MVSEGVGARIHRQTCCFWKSSILKMLRCGLRLKKLRAVSETALGEGVDVDDSKIFGMRSLLLLRR